MGIKTFEGTIDLEGLVDLKDLHLSLPKKTTLRGITSKTPYDDWFDSLD